MAVWGWESYFPIRSMGASERPFVGPLRDRKHRLLEQSHPNVIVFFTDQQRWDTTGGHDNPLDLTPNFDRMARRGYAGRRGCTRRAAAATATVSHCRPTCRRWDRASRTGVIRPATSVSGIYTATTVCASSDPFPKRTVPATTTGCRRMCSSLLQRPITLSCTMGTAMSCACLAIASMP